MEKTYSRQSSMSSNASPPRFSIPASTSPLHPAARHRRNDSASSLAGGARRRQNAATRMAAQRLARAMKSTDQNSSGDEEELGDDDDLMSVQSFDVSTPRRSSVRSSFSHQSIDQTASRTRTPSPAMGRYLTDQTATARPAIRTSTIRPSTLIPPSRRTGTSSFASDLPAQLAFNRREKGVSVDMGSLKVREVARPISSSSSLQDEIDLLQDENENILGKLGKTEEKCEAAEAKAIQLEKKVSFFGERMAAYQVNALSRKETVLPQRKVTRDEPMIENLQTSESELRSLRTVARRIILSHEEMEEVMLKRCWIARYWKLCMQHGIYADIAEGKYDYWSSFISGPPLEAVLSAGQKARYDTFPDKGDIEDDKHKISLDIIDKDTELSIQNLVLVEKGLRELASLKVEDAVLVSMGQQRHARMSSFSGLTPLAEVQSPSTKFDLTAEEKEDVQFKQAWLAYYWRRANNHGIEEDIADERLQFWIEQANHSPCIQDALEVERGLYELKKLGIESLLWEATRKEIDLACSPSESEG